MWRTICEGCWLLFLGLADARYKKVPIWMVLAGIPVGIAIGMPEILEGDGSAIGLALRFLPGVLMLFLTATQKAGYGDGLVLLVLGLAETGRDMLWIFVLSLVTLAVPAGALLVMRRVNRETRLPYLPFLFLSWGLGNLCL